MYYPAIEDANQLHLIMIGLASALEESERAQTAMPTDAAAAVAATAEALREAPIHLARSLRRLRRVSASIIGKWHSACGWELTASDRWENRRT